MYISLYGAERHKIKKMKFFVVSLGVLVLLTSCSSKIKKEESSEKEDSTAIVERFVDSKFIPIDSVWIEGIRAQTSKKVCQNVLEEDFKQRFNMRATVLSIKNAELVTAGIGHNNIKVIVEGKMRGVVRGEKNEYEFISYIKFEENDIANSGKVDFLQLHHKGKPTEQFYDWSKGTLISENIIKKQFIFNGISIRCIGLRELGVRYVTSRKMSRNEIVKFVTEETDMKRSNYYFQRHEGEAEYASFSCNRLGTSGQLYMYDSNNIYDVSINGTQYSFKSVY